MLFTLNHNSNNRVNYCNWKRIFITFLFLNTFLGCIYLIHEQKGQELTPSTINTPTWKKNESLIQTTTNAITFIRNTLANEYNHDDLLRFYDYVQKEYSLGLKCARKSNIVQAMDISNGTNRVTGSVNTTHSSSNHSHSSRFPRPDLHTFILDNSHACVNESVDLLIIIMSKSDNYKTRDAIRRTWTSGKNLGIYSSINIKYFFLIDFNEKLISNIRLENNLFHDIIQVELPEQYTLVTHRVISLFEWSFRYCRTAKFLFKTDDDIFVNLILLLKFISPLINQPKNDSFVISEMKIYGYKHLQPHVFRHATGSVIARYIITYDEYPCERYPTFVTGYGYLISKKARDAILYTAYQDPEPFRISDVYLTGIIPDYLSIPRHSMSNYMISDSNCEKFFNSSSAFACAGDSHHGVKNDVFSKYNQYWQLIKTKHRLMH